MNVYCYGSNPKIKRRNVHRLDETADPHRARLSNRRKEEGRRKTGEGGTSL